ncbi:hypothetical protein CWC05_05100 [Pseudoalteromonas ruthenica]|uniref:Spore coat protein U domain-containing protein n=2 Tax=Pseudoalteromonas TaxID=53246 RepID=A0A5S3Z702_9GAMM|nr:hypothetical protein CWC24_09260 [Pseudoalteromonas ruthenica]TMO48839.1 hypothetical protein CWC23_16800 [Pseudoalteromonas ruthenica]TMP88029.1 hypothetical protein CWC05_05100 [Pseudoalteromonas ruthenica]
MRKQNVIKICKLALMLASLDGSIATANEVSLAMYGYIKARCSVAFHQHDVELSNTRSSQAELDLRCNSPMTLTLYSQNGGLSHHNNDVLVPYRVTLTVPKAKRETVFSALQLKQGKAIHFEQVLFSERASLAVQLQQQLVFAGRYSDEIRLEITPDLYGRGL